MAPDGMLLNVTGGPAKPYTEMKKMSQSIVAAIASTAEQN
jgi:hypothetical protein